VYSKFIGWVLIQNLFVLNLQLLHHELDNFLEG
jgi:hypothetical protein